MELFLPFCSGKIGVLEISSIVISDQNEKLHQLVEPFFNVLDLELCELPKTLMTTTQSGGMMGVSACFQTGATMILRPRFSVSQFAHDIAVHKCTVMQVVRVMVRFRVRFRVVRCMVRFRVRCRAQVHRDAGR